VFELCDKDSKFYCGANEKRRKSVSTPLLGALKRCKKRSFAFYYLNYYSCIDVLILILHREKMGIVGRILIIAM
jgi:hypothetical protein